MPYLEHEIANVLIYFLQAAVLAAIQSAQAAAANGVVVQLDQQNANVRVFLKILGDLNTTLTK